MKQSNNHAETRQSNARDAASETAPISIMNE